ncbi:MAG: succinate dehydrogenase cytochrome b subunit [Candidatus Delongbacteria bacterium]|nr:succinate dehydrogenase cytochrome b subunit [Candidatus Delongbacteria bacterium]MBN2836684.1 succinate dehydrogenase cytochrome b subunit [Candidatus Delongbacteria bacterium]
MILSLGRILNSSIIKKVIVGVTGLMLSLFLVSHFIGNTLMMISAELFNTYAHTLINHPLIYFAEGGIVIVFLLHMVYAIRLIFENYFARPERYYVKKNSGRGATFASSTMKFTGPLIFIFLVMHLLNFKYGTHYDVVYTSGTMRDLNKLMLVYFSDWINIVLYIFFMAVVAFHVSHGVWSAFQTFGLTGPKCDKVLRIGAKLFALFVFVGYSIFPIWAYMQGGK